MKSLQLIADDRPKSALIYQDLCSVTPGGISSPVWASMSNEKMTPLIVEKASGDTITDSDENEYVDYCLSWGSQIHGHAHPEIISSVQAKLATGSSYGCCTPIQGDVAHKIREALPSCEKIRFVCSGTEATMTALRIARGYTGKSLLIKFEGNYHGHSDSFLVRAGSGSLEMNSTATSAGIPEEILRLTISLPYNDCEALELALSNPKISDNLAAIIVEPISGNMGVVPASAKFLNLLRKKTKELNAVLIFDEVITGFRISYGGAQSYYGIVPDLTTLGKIMSGGFPAAAIGGKSEIMNTLAPLGNVYQAGTMAGNPVSLAAGLKSIEILSRDGFYEELQRKSDLLLKPISDYIKDNNINCTLNWISSCFTLFFGVRSVSSLKDALSGNKKDYFAFFKHLFEHGIYFPPSQYESCYISSAHTDDNLIYTRDVILDYLRKI